MFKETIKKIGNFFGNYAPSDGSIENLNYIAKYKKGSNPEYAEKMKASLKIELDKIKFDNSLDLDLLPMGLISKETKIKIRALVIEDLKHRDKELEKWMPERSIETNP